MSGYWKWLYENTVKDILIIIDKLYGQIRKPSFDLIIWLTTITFFLLAMLSILSISFIFLAIVVLYLGISYAFYVDKK